MYGEVRHATMWSSGKSDAPGSRTTQSVSVKAASTSSSRSGPVPTRSLTVTSSALCLQSSNSPVVGVMKGGLPGAQQVHRDPALQHPAPRGSICHLPSLDCSSRAVHGDPVSRGKQEDSDGGGRLRDPTTSTQSTISSQILAKYPDLMARLPPRLPQVLLQTQPSTHAPNQRVWEDRKKAPPTSPGVSILALLIGSIL